MPTVKKKTIYPLHSSQRQDPNNAPLLFAKPWHWAVPDEKGVGGIVLGFGNKVLVDTQNVCSGSPRGKQLK